MTVLAAPAPAPAPAHRADARPAHAGAHAGLAPAMLAHAEHYQAHGYVVVPGLIPTAMAGRMRDHYMQLRTQGPKPGDMGGNPANPQDPLNAFPRFIQMHDWDAASVAWSFNPGVVAVASACIRQEAVLCQTMLYFKPPGARGQALHQDQQYICRDPLIGAWVALDRCDVANGQMMVIPDSEQLGLLPVQKDDGSQSFSGGEAVVPKGYAPVGIDMEPGDVLFFSGSTIHGSYPNRTSDRFRRGFICHYVGAQAVDFKPKTGQHMSDLSKMAP